MALNIYIILCHIVDTGLRSIPNYPLIIHGAYWTCHVTDTGFIPSVTTQCVLELRKAWVQLQSVHCNGPDMTGLIYTEPSRPSNVHYH